MSIVHHRRPTVEQIFERRRLAVGSVLALRARKLGGKVVQILTRTAWGSSWSHPGSGQVRPHARRGVIVHHSVTAEGGDRASVSQILRGIENLDRHTNGWMGSYNYAIDHSGSIYELTGLTTIGTHAARHNTAYWGVCYIGDGRVSFPAAAQQALFELIAWLVAQAGHGLEVLGHGEVNSTACPGPIVQAALRPSGETPPMPENGNPTGLRVDGMLGRKTIAALQERLRELKYYSGPIDGKIDIPISLTVTALQRHLNDNGATPALAIDGAGLVQTGLKTHTIAALQAYLGTPVDGVLSLPSSQAVRALQSRLNEKSL